MAKNISHIGVGKLAAPIPVLGAVITGVEGAMDTWRSYDRMRREVGEVNPISRKKLVASALGIGIRYGLPIGTLILAATTGIGLLPFALVAVGEAMYDIGMFVGRRSSR